MFNIEPFIFDNSEPTIKGERGGNISCSCRFSNNSSAETIAVMVMVMVMGNIIKKPLAS